jgi:hypothetical protein
MRNVEIGAIDREIGPLKSGEKKDRYSKWSEFLAISEIGHWKNSINVEGREGMKKRKLMSTTNIWNCWQHVTLRSWINFANVENCEMMERWILIWRKKHPCETHLHREAEWSSEMRELRLHYEISNAEELEGILSCQRFTPLLSLFCNTKICNKHIKKVSRKPIRYIWRSITRIITSFAIREI